MRKKNFFRQKIKMTDFKSNIKSASLKELEEMTRLIREEIESRKSVSGKLKVVETYSDGASRGNPGDAAVGVLICDDDGNKLHQQGQTIGQCTNNEAEYRALLLALENALKFTTEKVSCFLDSELVVRQLNGRYEVKSEKMKGFYNQVLQMKKKFSSITFTHVPREHPNLRIVDGLANQALDNAKRMRF